MKVLFIHQNFPAQFVHLAPFLKARGHECHCLTDFHNTNPTTVRRWRYKSEPLKAPPGPATHYAAMAQRGFDTALAARQLRDQFGFYPDLIIGHPGWGETLYLKDVWPKARLILYGEFYYSATGADVGFDPEFGTPPNGISTTAQNAHLAHALVQADLIVSPTQWQASRHPHVFQPRQRIIFDGILTDHLHPKADAVFIGKNGMKLSADSEVITFVNRNLEPYRGYHCFMRALPALLAARPSAQVVIVGGDGTSYGRAPPGASTWREIFFNEVRDHIDTSRVHFTGRIPYADYVALLRVSRLHVYLTYPFVLSWSLLEAMCLGAPILASDTAPVREVIRDGENGQLFDFFDTDELARRAIGILEDRETAKARAARARADIRANYDLTGCALPNWQVAIAEVMAG